MKIKRITIIFLSGFAACLLLAQFVSAENSTENNAENSNIIEKDARAMLKTDQTVSISEIDHQLTEKDFSWSALTKNGAASGQNPKIGYGSGKAFYDFRDGLSAPQIVSANR